MDKKHTEKNNKIPKIIHYCWFGGKPIPEELRACMDSWKKLKGYKVIRWDETNCSFNENEFVRRTYAEKKLGFIGDYYRLKAVYEYGGIYLDTDVMINRSFDGLLSHTAFLNFIFDCSVGSAVIGAEKGNALIGNLMKMYDATVFTENKNGKTLEWRDGKCMVNGYVTSNYYYTYFILKHYPEFRLNNKMQVLKDFVIYPKEFFEIGTLSGKHYAVHLCAGEWRSDSGRADGTKSKIKSVLKRNPKVFEKIQILVRKRRYRKMKKEIPFYAYYLAQRNHEELPEL